MSKWDSEKEELERLINIEKVSYEEIGRRYGCSGANIKKQAKLLGIELPQRRKINPCETFNKGTGEKQFCLYCGKELKYRSHKPRFCDNTCYAKYKEQEYIKRWLEGKENGLSGKYGIITAVRNYIFRKNNNECECCHKNYINPYTNLSILQIHHIDGDCTNNKEENLQLLCPNCHAMTENYGSRNRGNATRIDNRMRY